MKFDPTLIPEGIAAKHLRGFLRTYRWVGWPDTLLDATARISRTEITEWFDRDLADMLVKKGLVERTSPGKYRLTQLGNRLAVQPLNPRISRTKADKIVAELLDRARRINDDPEQVDYVAKIIAFGSYIRDTDDLGDIDLVIETKRRPMSHEEFARRSEALRVKAERSGRWFRDPGDRLCFPEHNFKKLLRNRCRYLSFHPEHDLKPEFPSKAIFASEPVLD